MLSVGLIGGVMVQDQLVDVTLLCDGGSYPAHRLVLAACSPYFHQLFTRLPTQHPLIYLRDVKQAELEALLEFIYRGEVRMFTVSPECWEPCTKQGWN